MFHDSQIIIQHNVPDEYFSNMNTTQIRISIWYTCISLVPTSFGWGGGGGLGQKQCIHKHNPDFFHFRRGFRVTCFTQPCAWFAGCHKESNRMAGSCIYISSKVLTLSDFHAYQALQYGSTLCICRQMYVCCGNEYTYKLWNTCHIISKYRTLPPLSSEEYKKTLSY